MCCTAYITQCLAGGNVGCLSCRFLFRMSSFTPDSSNMVDSRRWWPNADAPDSTTVAAYNPMLAAATFNASQVVGSASTIEVTGHDSSAVDDVNDLMSLLIPSSKQDELSNSAADSASPEPDPPDAVALQPSRQQFPVNFPPAQNKRHCPSLDLATPIKHSQWLQDFTTAVDGRRSASPRKQCNVLYSGVFLNSEYANIIRAMINSKHPEELADDMVLWRQPPLRHIFGLQLGKEVKLNITGSAFNDFFQAVSVEPPSWLPATTEPCAYITLSLAFGHSSAEAGRMLADAMSGIGCVQYTPLGHNSFCIMGRLGIKMLDGSVLYSLDELVERQGLDPATIESLCDADADVASLATVRCKPKCPQVLCL